MAAITQRINNFLGGVSRQPDSKKLPGQVRECLNAYPDPTLGLVKRPGFKYLDILKDSNGTSFAASTLDNARWFYINRDDDERYVGCIVSGDIHIWNTIPDANGNFVKATVTYSNNNIISYNPTAYLNTTKDNYSIVTVQDTSVITNNTFTVSATPAPTYTAGLSHTLKLTGVEYSAEYQVTINGQTATITTRNADNFSTGGTNKALSADDILNDIVTQINTLGISGLSVTTLDTTIELSCSSAISVSAKGGKDTSLFTAFSDQVESVAKLPEQSVAGRVVKIINTDSTNDTYYAKFIANNGSSGDGFWEETVGFGVSTGLDATTMPHELINTSLNNFVFQPITYTARLSGDDVSNSHPSFVNNKIQQTFFHNNRLGFLTSDNVSMSQTSEFFNFYHISALTQTDADPLDLNCSSIKPAVLHAVLPTAQGLVLFSQKQQFLMFSDDQVLTPTSSVIRTISNYEMDPKIDPVDSGGTLAFVSKTPGFSRVFAMQTRGSQENPIVVDISRIVAEWVPDTVQDLITSTSNNFIALFGPSSNYIWFYRTYNDGTETLVQSWYRWYMPGKVHQAVVDNDRMYCVVEAGGKYMLLTASLTQTPDDEILVNSNGQKINPYLDMYAPASSVSYDSTTRISKCYLPYDDISSLTPALIIKGSGSNNFNTANSGPVQSGFTISPERGVDGTGPYFLVPELDLTGVASDVIVGYKFNYDIELPTIFLTTGQKGEITDFTASVTIARMKFSVGLSSGLGFKIQAKGRTEWTDVLPSVDANYYLADDVPLEEENIFTVPLHQRSENVSVRLYSDTPFPVSLISMMWEGNYSPRFYRRM